MLYRYIAFHRDDGRELRGVLEAASEKAAEEALWQQDCIVASLRQAGTLDLAGLASFLEGKLGDVLFLGLVLALILGFHGMRTQGPLVAITGRSMEPTLRAGDLLLVKGIAPEEIREGDILVFNVSPALRETYNYPPVVAHRVIEVVTSGDAPAFRTKGDNTGHDPFTVFPRDLRGTTYQRIPYLGFIPLFLSSRQGLFFALATIFLISLYYYAEQLGRGADAIQRVLFGPILEGDVSSRREIKQKLEDMEQTLKKLGALSIIAHARPTVIVPRGPFDDDKFRAEGLRKVADQVAQLDALQVLPDPLVDVPFRHISR